MKNNIRNVSLLALIMVTVSPISSDAKVNVKNNNRSYADAYNQVAYVREQAYIDANAPTATTASATDNLPVRVADQDLAKAIASNTSDMVSRSDLDACAMIFPTGEFQWAIPESGIRKPQNQTCVATIKLIDAKSRAVLATTTLAAGDAMKCNIEMFPQSGYLPALENVYLPNDTPPTMEDVEKAMNEEQKQNAGIKIAAGAILMGLGGNLLAPKKAGDDKLIGTGKDQLIGTAIGMAGGAGIMAASTYSGKVAGDTIKSTAVNAAAGMVVGNMAAGISGSDSVLSITKCSKEGDFSDRDCVVGYASMVDETNAGYTFTQGKTEWYIKKDGKSLMKCENETITSGGRAITRFNCKENQSSSGFTDYMCTIGDSDKKCFNSGFKDSDIQDRERYSLQQSADGTSNDFVEQNNYGDYIKVTKATKTTDRKRAYAVFSVNIPAKPLGYKVSDFDELEKQHHANIKYYYRNADGSVASEITVTKSDDKNKNAESPIRFDASAKDAADGGLVDLTNEARAKGTMAGAGVGGAMGGFSGYQGAKQEISDRYIAEKQAYDDSLSNFACMTGGRFLAKYNDYAEIPEMKKSE